jgi:tetratricopeptide (TPR) repeat protein
MPCLRLLPLVLLLAMAGGCATYGDWVGEMERQIAAQDLPGALAILKDRTAQHERDAVLYDLNRAMLLRMAGDYAQSNGVFEEAKAAIDRLDAVSVTEQTGAFAVNDMLRSYTGEPFERILLHVYAALNYLELGRPDDARVEILQLDVLLGQEDHREGEAFARYLSGMIFESLGQYDDAMIAYRQAYTAYHRSDAAGGVPPSLGRDLVRMAVRVGGLEDELRTYRKEFGLPEGVPGPQAEEGELIFLLHSGLVPIKRDNVIGAAARDGKLVMVSMPYYENRVPRVTGARLSAGATVATTVMAEDVDAVALATLEREKPAILARAIARAAVKHEASERADRQGDLLGVVVNIAGAVAERADTRSWSTLPNRIYLARLPLAAGRHEVHVELQDYSGIAATRDYTVDIAPGAKRFISLHWVTAGDLQPLTYRTERRPLQ